MTTDTNHESQQQPPPPPPQQPPQQQSLYVGIDVAKPQLDLARSDTATTDRIASPTTKRPSPPSSRC